MALIRCRECGAQISDLAQSCPNCGCPVAYSLGGQPPFRQTPPWESAQTPVQQETQQSFQQSAQQTSQQVFQQPAVYSSPEPSDPGKSSGKRKKLALICGICLGAVALAVGAFFLIRSLTESSGHSVYYPPVSNNNYSQTHQTQPTATDAATEPLATTTPTAVVMPASLEGDWTSSFMDTVTFEAGGGAPVRRHRQYDYDRSSWVETSCTVREVTQDTVTCIHGDGTLESVFYSVSENGTELTLDGVCYRKVTETTDTTMKQYISTGIPAFGNTYFGMTKEEVKQYADSGYRFTNDSGTDFYHLPALLSNQTTGFVTYRFDDRERLETVTVYLDEDANEPGKYEALLQQITTLYTKWYGVGREKVSSYYNAYYTWEFDSVTLRYSESDDLDVTLSFDLTKTS